MSRKKVRDFYVYEKLFGNGEKRLYIVNTKNKLLNTEVVKFGITTIVIVVDGKEIKIKI